MLLIRKVVDGAALLVGLLFRPIPQKAIPILTTGRHILGARIGTHMVLIVAQPT